MADAGSPSRVLLGRYQLTEPLGRGGMGEVWAAWDRRLQREVAVKLLRPELSAEPSFRERFHREATSAASLDHPNIVNVFDVDEDTGALFIVMERLPGPSLDQRIADGPLAAEEVRRVADDLLSGLGAAHRAHLVHRDVKPGNLIRSAGGRWKLGDFGVAKDLAATATLTLAGVPVGTPAYLAPEQLHGLASTPATDLWAAAIVLREAVTGQRPFTGEDPVAVAHAVQTTPLVPLQSLRPDLDAALTSALDRALSIDASQRFTSAEEMLAAIEGRAVAAPPPPTPPAEAAPPPAAPSDAPPPGPVPAGAAVQPPAGAPPAGPPTDDDDAATTRWIWWVVAVAIGAMMVLLLLALLALAVDDDDAEGGPGEGTEPTPASVPTTMPTLGPTELPTTSELPTSELPTSDSAPSTTTADLGDPAPDPSDGEGVVPGGTQDGSYPDDEQPQGSTLAPGSTSP